MPYRQFGPRYRDLSSFVRSLSLDICSIIALVSVSSESSVSFLISAANNEDEISLTWASRYSRRARRVRVFSSSGASTYSQDSASPRLTQFSHAGCWRSHYPGGQFRVTNIAVMSSITLSLRLRQGRQDCGIRFLVFLIFS